MRKSLILFICVILLVLPTLVFAQSTPTGVHIVNTILTTGTTEYRVALGQGIKAFLIQLRGSYDLRLAYAAGETATKYFTIKSASSPIYYSPNINWNGVLYLRCDTAAQIAEIEYWR